MCVSYNPVFCLHIVFFLHPHFLMQGKQNTSTHQIRSLLLHLIPHEIKNKVTSFMFFWDDIIMLFNPKNTVVGVMLGLCWKLDRTDWRLQPFLPTLISLDSDQIPLNIISHWHQFSLLRLRPQLHQPPNTSTHIYTWTHPTGGDKLVCTPADSQSLLQSGSSGVVMILPQQQ